jgi:hypothetical protein
MNIFNEILMIWNGEEGQGFGLPFSLTTWLKAIT